MDGPCVVDLKGRRRLYGFVSVIDISLGESMIAIVMPRANGDMFTQVFNLDVIYSLTPTTEEFVYQRASSNELPTWPTRIMYPETEQSDSADCHSEPLELQAERKVILPGE